MTEEETIENIVQDNLLQGIKLGNCETFRYIYDKFYISLCSHANVFVNDIDESEEIVQNIICKLWENRESFSVTENVVAYLYRSVKNAAINRIKHIQVIAKFKDYLMETIELEESDSNLEKSELYQLINDALETLPEKTRKIFQLHRFENLRYSEIAEKEEVSIKTVEYHISNAIKLLTVRLKKQLNVSIIIIVTMFYNRFF